MPAWQERETFQVILAVRSGWGLPAHPSLSRLPLCACGWSDGYGQIKNSSYIERLINFEQNEHVFPQLNTLKFEL